MSRRRPVSEQREVRLSSASTRDSRDLREAVRTAALQCGFDQVGFAPAEAPLHAQEYREWLSQDFHGEMSYMGRPDAVARRVDPREALSGCRTIIVTSLVYGPQASWGGAAAIPEEHADSRGSDERSGRRLPVIARYAKGRDYHDVFETRLDQLASAIRALAPNAITKRYVDYGPVLERDHAQRAGLGWIGKNTMLIEPTLGSYFMLGELLTDLDLPPDEPFVADRCGTCDRCMVACPTDAIVAERSLDARRCISYLTIELKGSIPVDLRAAIGNRIFGCDICQEVCPWNADSPVPEHGPFGLAPGRPVPPDDMVQWSTELLALDEQRFRARYEGTALSRPGRAGLLRNLAVGLGNTGDETALPVLRRMIEDESELVREHAQWALERHRTENTGS